MNADLFACASSGGAIHATQLNWVECSRTERRQQASIVKATCLGAWSGSVHAGLRDGLSRVKGNFHARFLGGCERATAHAYPVAALRAKAR